MSLLSVVLPAYNEELMIKKTCRVLKQVLTEAEIAYELVLVNDGSRDRTWEEIQKAEQRILIFWVLNFPGISEKKQLFLQALLRHPVMQWR